MQLKFKYSPSQVFLFNFSNFSVPSHRPICYDPSSLFNTLSKHVKNDFSNRSERSIRPPSTLPPPSIRLPSTIHPSLG